MEKVCIGKAVRLHGYLGQLKINTKYDDDFDILGIKTMFDENGNALEVTRIFKTKDGIVVGFKNIDLNLAKQMINKPLFVNREMFEGKILIEDLKGSSVFIDNKLVGKIVDVQDYGAAEVFYMLSNENKEILFPNVGGLIESFYYREKKLVLNQKRFAEVTDENWYFNTFSK